MKIYVGKNSAAKFLNTFPPAATTFVLGVILVLLLMVVPKGEFTWLGLTLNGQTVTTVGMIIVMLAAKAIGVSLSEVFELVKLVSNDEDTQKLAGKGTAENFVTPTAAPLAGEDPKNVYVAVRKKPSWRGVLL